MILQYITEVPSTLGLVRVDEIVYSLKNIWKQRVLRIQIYKLKEGVSFGDGAPNNDIYELACKVSAKRLYPNFVNLDAPYNKEIYIEGRPETEVATMGCVASFEKVMYKNRGKSIITTFDHAWNDLSFEYSDRIHKYSEDTMYIDLYNTGVKVYDSSSGGYVKAKKIIINRVHDINTWKNLKFISEDGVEKYLYATYDHPLPIIDKGRTLVQDLELGDKVYRSNINFDNDVMYNDNIGVYTLVSVNNISDSDNVELGYSYDFETESDMLDISFIQSHNCRTRVASNVYDKDKAIIPGRGNLSFTSINLPRLGILANGDIDKFFSLLDKKLELVHRQLLERFDIQCMKHPINYPFLMGQGLWLGSDRLGPTDDIREVLKHGTLGIGFIGLAETLVALIGKHHGESEEAQELGLRIIRHMKAYADAWSKDEHMNYSILGTPAEGLSGRFIRIDKERFGIIPGVTDKEYYTNSNHKYYVA